MVFQSAARLRILSAALLLSLGLSACPNYYSQDFVRQLDQSYYDKWPRDYVPGKTYTPRSLGEELMPYFRDHAQACGLFSGLNMAFPDRDYIPSEIQNYTGTPLNTRVAPVRRLMGENVFYYVFPQLTSGPPQADLAFEPLFATDEAGVSRTFGLSRDYPVLPEKSENAWRVRQTCGGYLNSHLSSSVEGQQGPPLIPYGAFKAAVQSDRELKSSVVGVSGTFTSPLTRLLNEDEITPDAINLKLRLWYHYRQQAAQGKLSQYLEQMRLLGGFRGLMISRATESGSINALDANGVMTLDLNRMLNVEGKLDARYSVKNTFDAVVYNTLIYCNDQSCDLKPLALPAPEALLSSFKRIQPEGGQDAFSAIQPGRTLRFWQDVAGIPDTYCNPGQARWQLDMTKNGEIFNPALKPRLSVAPLPLDRDGVQRCRFMVEGQLRSDRSADQLAGGQPQLELGFELVNTDPLKHQDQSLQLRIPGRMVFSARNQIQPVVLGKEPVSYERVGSDPRRMTLKWEFDVMFREEQAGAPLVDYGRMSRLSARSTELIRLLENRLEKAGDERLEIRAVPDAQERQFYRVTVLSSKRIDFSEPGSLADEPYTLKTELQVPLKNKETQSVPLELRLSYPVPLASPEAEKGSFWDLFQRP